MGEVEQLRAHLDAIRWLLVLIVGLAAAYFLVPDDQPSIDKPTRDLEREHALGAHRHTAAWGCKACQGEKK